MIRIGGERLWLWRAVDDEGEVLDMLVQRRRDTKAALRLMRKLLRNQGFAPEVLVTDKLAPYGCARRNSGSAVATSRGSEPTIELRTRTNRSVGESGRRNGSSRPALPSASCPCTRRP